MKLSKKAILFLSFLLISFCGNNDEINESTNNSNLQTPNEKVEDSNQEENSSQEKGSSLQEAIDEIIQTQNLEIIEHIGEDKGFKTLGGWNMIDREGVILRKK